MADVEEMVFPVVAFPTGSAPCLISTERGLAVWPVTIFKTGLTGMKIVDSAGDEYVVVAARKAGYPGHLWGFSLVSERTMCVDFSIDKAGRRLGVQDVRDIILADLLAAFGDHLDGEYDEGEASAALSGATSVADLFADYASYLGVGKT